MRIEVLCTVAAIGGIVNYINSYAITKLMAWQERRKR